MTRIAIYPGSFDPPTRGHEDLIRRALGLADDVIVAVAENLRKEPMFTVAERVELLRAVSADLDRVRITSFKGLLADFAREHDARLVIRGLRAAGDFEYEFQMALMNRRLGDGLETVFLVPRADLAFVSSTLVREVARFGGEMGELVHPTVAEALRGKAGR